MSHFYNQDEIGIRNFKSSNQNFKNDEECTIFMVKGYLIIPEMKIAR
ncbi:hypothetical protein [Runella rosea]|nr:hypothetical protein [Runella rosea]